MIKEGLPAYYEHGESVALTNKKEAAEYSTTSLNEVAPIVPFIGYILVVWLESANRRFHNGNYDFGVIATLIIARGYEALIEFCVPHNIPCNVHVNIQSQ